MIGFLQRLFGGAGKGFGMDELAKRLGTTVDKLQAVRPAYREFRIPKRSGGVRRIVAPEPPLKTMQKTILRRLLRRLKAHPAATGFESGYSIVSNAFCHVGRPVVVRMDLKDFFESTATKRVNRYFQSIGWNRPASDWLTEICTFKDGLPQGAPTSPRLSNLVNYRMDARLDKLAEKFNAAYSRYADDITFSLAADHRNLHGLISMVAKVVEEEGYTLHRHKKLHIRRQHEQQVVTGLVVNRRINLRRRTRRWLRAIEHHARTGKPVTLTPAQIEGWRSLQAMIKKQAKSVTGGGASSQ
jgi:retron-type reverse transcriptase